MNKELTDFFGQFSAEVAETAAAIFEMTERVMIPEKKMWIDHADRMITFGAEKNMKGEICYIKPLKDSVNLGFFHGVKLDDPDNLLQGTGKSLRHIKLKKKPEANAAAIQRILEDALREHNERQ
ncbi:MAG: DUF1801 domain-containing protein [Saprospiraceae bacterium]